MDCEAKPSHTFPSGTGASSGQGDILGRWRQAVKETFPLTDELTSMLFESRLPGLLDYIADRLISGTPASADASTTDVLLTPSTVGITQLQSGPTSIQYQLLRRMVLSETSRFWACA